MSSQFQTNIVLKLFLQKNPLTFYSLDELQGHIGKEYWDVYITKAVHKLIKEDGYQIKGGKIGALFPIKISVVKNDLPPEKFVEYCSDKTYLDSLPKKGDMVGDYKVTYRVDYDTHVCISIVHKDCVFQKIKFNNVPKKPEPEF